MESRAFIRTAAALVDKINNPAADRDVVQKEIKQAFTGLQNPTLPSASRLCAAATKAGYVVSPDIQHRLTQAEGYWS